MMTVYEQKMLQLWPAEVCDRQLLRTVYTVNKSSAQWLYQQLERTLTSKMTKKKHDGSNLQQHLQIYAAAQDTKTGK